MFPTSTANRGGSELNRNRSIQLSTSNDCTHTQRSNILLYTVDSPIKGDGDSCGGRYTSSCQQHITIHMCACRVVLSTQQIIAMHNLSLLLVSGMTTVPLDTPNVIASLVLLSSTVKVSLISTISSGAMAMLTHCLVLVDDRNRTKLTGV